MTDWFPEPRSLGAKGIVVLHNVWDRAKFSALTKLFNQ